MIGVFLLNYPANVSNESIVSGTFNWFLACFKSLS